VSFSHLYHTHHSLHTEDLAFWLDLAGQRPGPILELGCGTGRVLIPLAQSGQVVVGLDNDPGMLALLQANLPPALQQNVRVFRADFTRFRLACSFGLILMPCNTYSTLSPEERRLTLIRVREHLSRGGEFAVSLPNPDWLRSLPARSAAEVEEVFAHPLDDEPVQVSSAWRRTRQEFVLVWHYDHLKPDGTVERLTVQRKHHLAPVADYLAEFRAAGFAQLQSFGDFDRSVFSADSPELILLAA
jgi:SAM-dependent methyltransferase